jgi:hypothetical protein
VPGGAGAVDEQDLLWRGSAWPLMKMGDLGQDYV